MAASLGLILRNDMADLARAQVQIETFLSSRRTDAETLYLVRLVVEELMSNVIRYAYADQRGHQIEVTVVVIDDAVELTVVDDGRPFDPSGERDITPAAMPEEAAVGGRGLLLVREMAGPIHYERKDGRNRVTVRVSAPQGR